MCQPHISTFRRFLAQIGFSLNPNTLQKNTQTPLGWSTKIFQCWCCFHYASEWYWYWHFYGRGCLLHTTHNRYNYIYNYIQQDEWLLVMAVMHKPYIHVINLKLFFIFKCIFIYLNNRWIIFSPLFQPRLTDSVFILSVITDLCPI